jgi:hypothetical protein
LRFCSIWALVFKVTWFSLARDASASGAVGSRQALNRRKVEMFPSISSFALGATLLIAVADRVPTLNVEPGCRAAAKIGDSLNSSLQQCMADEKAARDQLEKEWTQFAPALRERCAMLTRSGGDPSYVEVLICMQMGRDAAKMEKSSTDHKKGN